MNCHVLAGFGQLKGAPPLLREQPSREQPSLDHTAG